MGIWLIHSPGEKITVHFENHSALSCKFWLTGQGPCERQPANTLAGLHPWKTYTHLPPIVRHSWISQRVHIFNSDNPSAAHTFRSRARHFRFSLVALLMRVSISSFRAIRYTFILWGPLAPATYTYKTTKEYHDIVIVWKPEYFIFLCNYQV